MPENSNDNILSNLRTLIWGAFIGVVSFQVLAPTVWSYLHNSLGMGYFTSYWIFTCVYFLVLPVFVFGWLYENRKLVIEYLPDYKGKATRESKLFLKGLLGFIALQFLVTLSGFIMHWKETMFYVICSFYTVCCGLLLVACYFFCDRHIRHFFKPQQDGLDANNTDKQVIVLRKARKFFHQLFWPTVMVYLFLFIVAFAFICNWFKNNKKIPAIANNHSSFEAGKRSFALQYLNDSVQLKSARLKAIEDSAADRYFDDNLDSIVKGAQKNTGTDTMPVNVILKAYLDSVRLWNRSIDALFETLGTKPDKITGDSIVKLADTSSLGLQYISLNSKIVTKEDLNFIGLLKTYLKTASDKITRAAKMELGIQLRSVQAKGILLLISLFFTLLALYIFFKIINRMQSLQLEMAKDDQELKTDLAESGASVGNLWLMITVTAWLLLPIFKTVNDEDINLKEPYKTPTVSGNKDLPGALPPADFRHSKHDSTIRIFEKFDTLKVKLVGTAAGLDSPSVSDLLKEISTKVDNVQQQVGGVKKDVDTVGNKVTGVENKVNDVKKLIRH